MIRQYFSRERVKGRRQPYCPVNVAFTSSHAYNVSCQERAVQRDLRTGFESMRFSRLADILQPQHGNLSNLKSSLQLKFRHPPTDLKAPVSCMPLTTMQQYDVITDTIQRLQQTQVSIQEYEMQNCNLSLLLFTAIPSEISQRD